MIECCLIELVRIFGRFQRLDNPLVLAKLRLPDADWTYYVTRVLVENTFTVSGYLLTGVQFHSTKFTLAHLEALRGPLGFRTELDVTFHPVRLSDLWKRAYQTPMMHIGVFVPYGMRAAG
jgi:hypothetical protein